MSVISGSYWRDPAGATGALLLSDDMVEKEALARVDGAKEEDRRAEAAGRTNLEAVLAEAARWRMVLEAVLQTVRLKLDMVRIKLLARDKQRFGCQLSFQIKRGKTLRSQLILLEKKKGGNGWVV